MKILVYIHGYVPDQLAGAETMLHRMNKYLISKGHDIIVLSQHDDKVYEGVTVRKWERKNQWMDENVSEFKWADIVITHLGSALDCMNKCQYHGKKMVFINHNSFPLRLLEYKKLNNYMVYNSQWVKDALKYDHPSIILNPPVDYREYSKVDTSKAKYVTLINLNESKGGGFLIELAKALPKVEFLGVTGGYGHQIKSEEELPNLKYIDSVEDIKTVLKDTKLLIVPSNYESWGQVAIEAASCGIPVIANPTPGLREALGDAGVYADRNNIDEWVKEIKSLTGKKEVYAKQSEKIKARAVELDPQLQLHNFEHFLLGIQKKIYWT